MRIDVDRGGTRLEAELDALYPHCLKNAAADGTIFLPELHDSPLSRYRRTADGETFLYIEDPEKRWLAGSISLNRVTGMDRRLDRFIRSPHSRLREPYQCQGLATRLYLEALNAGLCLLSGARQSPGALQLWRSLSEYYPLHHVRLEGKLLVDLGRSIEWRTFEDLHTRLLLCGAGWSANQLLALARPSERKLSVRLRLKQQTLNAQARRSATGIGPGHRRANVVAEQQPADHGQHG